MVGVIDLLLCGDFSRRIDFISVDALLLEGKMHRVRSEHIPPPLDIQTMSTK